MTWNLIYVYSDCDKFAQIMQNFKFFIFLLNLEFFHFLMIWIKF